MNDRSRAVTCQYKGGGYCSLTTKDTSELCHHHRRNSLLHTTTPGGAPKLRLTEATKRLVSGDTAAINGKIVLDHMPRVQRAMDHVVVTMGAARQATDTVVWNDHAVTITDNVTYVEATELGPLHILKDGSTVRARLDSTHPKAMSELLTQAYNTRTHAARRLFEAQGMFNGLAERYDDKAEVLVQLPLNEDPNISVSYTSATDGSVKLRIASKAEDGTPQVETYSVFTSQYKMLSDGTVEPNNQVQMPGMIHRNGVSEPVPESMSNPRAQLFENISEALNVIDTYSVTGNDDALYLPVGWMER